MNRTPTSNTPNTDSPQQSALNTSKARTSSASSPASQSNTSSPRPISFAQAAAVKKQQAALARSGSTTPNGTSPVSKATLPSPVSSPNSHHEDSPLSVTLDGTKSNGATLPIVPLPASAVDSKSVIPALDGPSAFSVSPKSGSPRHGSSNVKGNASVSAVASSPVQLPGTPSRLSSQPILFGTVMQGMSGEVSIGSEQIQNDTEVSHSKEAESKSGHSTPAAASVAGNGSARRPMMVAGGPSEVRFGTFGTADGMTAGGSPSNTSATQLGGNPSKAANAKPIAVAKGRRDSIHSQSTYISSPASQHQAIIPPSMSPNPNAHISTPFTGSNPQHMPPSPHGLPYSPIHPQAVIGAVPSPNPPLHRSPNVGAKPGGNVPSSTIPGGTGQGNISAHPGHGLQHKKSMTNQSPRMPNIPGGSPMGLMPGMDVNGGHGVNVNHGWNPNMASPHLMGYMHGYDANAAAAAAAAAQFYSGAPPQPHMFMNAPQQYSPQLVARGPLSSQAPHPHPVSGQVSNPLSMSRMSIATPQHAHYQQNAAVIAPTAAPFVSQPKVSRAIKIINPNTLTEVKAESSTATPNRPTPAAPSKSSSVVVKPNLAQSDVTAIASDPASSPKPPTTQAFHQFRSPVNAPVIVGGSIITPPGSRAIKIVNPATREKEEQEKKEGQEQEKREKEEQERKDREAREPRLADENALHEKKEKVVTVVEKQDDNDLQHETREAADSTVPGAQAHQLKGDSENKQQVEDASGEQSELADDNQAERKSQDEVYPTEQIRESPMSEVRTGSEDKTSDSKVSESDETNKDAIESSLPEESSVHQVEAGFPAVEDIAATAAVIENAREEANNEHARAMEKATAAHSDAVQEPASKPEKLDLAKISGGSLADTATPAISVLQSPNVSRRNIDDLSTVSYPAGIKTPAPENPETGKFKYDRAFLMQFMEICLDKPDALPPLDEVGMLDGTNPDKRPGLVRKGTSSRGGPRTPISGPGSPMDSMGAFKHIPRTSEERFAASMHNMGNMGKFAGGKALGNRGAAGGVMGGVPGQREGSGRSKSGRGGGKRQGGRDLPPSQGGPTIPLDQVAPLEFSENRWTPASINAAAQQISKDGPLPMEIVVRKVKALLNKLTLEKFERISDQILEYANQSVNETDGRTLKIVIQLTFEKATDEPNFEFMYARLCRKLLDKVSADIRDESVKDPKGNGITGGNLFRKYLLNRCQEDFERGWKVDLPEIDQAAADTDPLLTEEYYIAQKAKRRGLGLVRFIGELFKLQMLTVRIMHDCIQKLLSNVTDPGEEEVESLCKFMTTVGKDLDKDNGARYMNAYFELMGKLSKNEKLSSRIRFMLLDVIELRNVCKWMPRRDAAGPKTLQQIHEDAAKAKEEESYLKSRSSSSGGRLPGMAQQLLRENSSRGRDRSGPNTPTGNAPDGWNTVGNVPQTSRKVGDLTNFGKVDRTKGMRPSLGPSSSVFSSLSGGKGWTKQSDASPNRKDDKASVPMTPTSSSIGTANMFSALGGEHHGEDAESKERPKLKLLPKGTSLNALELPAESPSSDGPSSQQPIDKPIDAEKMIKSMLEEFWAVRDIQELEYCVKNLGGKEDNLTNFVVTSSSQAIERKLDEVLILAKAFSHLVAEDVLRKSILLKGFSEFLQLVDDISIDVPNACQFTGRLFKDSGLDMKELFEVEQDLIEQRSDLVPPAAKITAAYLRAYADSEGDESMAAKFREVNFDIKTFFKEDRRSSDAINQFLRKEKLEQLIVS
ncbi:hypothetical protein BZG36_03411 [Bifiguratus adelaidae]|uniref:MI domain-containing protein n=1 Tax=Bifiguratus adelaidae TaxID=1938954 RepID=A0A261XYT3_9FUNG|nr:hypothetical protein BZG36_03411 [Bifiguratus adelaidae]